MRVWISGLLLAFFALGCLSDLDGPEPALAPVGIDLTSQQVEERPAGGTVVGVLKVRDPNASDQHVLTLIDDAGGRFAIDGDRLVVAESGLLDFESSTSHEVVVRAADSAGLLYEEALTIEVLDVYEVSSLQDSGPGTLRAGIASAEEGDRILFEELLSGIIDLASPLTIETDVDIVGPGSDQLTIAGQDSVQILNVEAGARASLSGATLTDGRTVYGGAVYNEGFLELSEVIVTSSTAVGISGSGGAIYNRGVMSIDHCTLSGNVANSGGAIRNDGELDVAACTIEGNTVNDFDGGAIYNNGPLHMVNSTISNNQALGLDAGRGGGLFVKAHAVTELVHCTIADNAAEGTGGGIHVSIVGELVMRGCIVANNTTNDINPDVSVEDGIVDFQMNLIGDGAGAGVADGDGSNVVGVDPLLGPLENNGGGSLTHMPVDVSPAVDFLPLADCVDTDGNAVEVDQRGINRPRGAGCDAGAVERF